MFNLLPCLSPIEQLLENPVYVLINLHLDSIPPQVNFVNLRLINLNHLFIFSIFLIT